MRTRPRTASFRRAVVSVTAAFAAAPGCSIDHAADGPPVNPPSCDEQSTLAGCIPPVDCTTASPPERGAPCSEEGASCEYDSCTTPGGIGEAVCADGHWELSEVSCNPPPPLECPADVPEYGSACQLPSDLQCFMEECEVGEFWWFCEDGRWRIEDSCASVNPPPPEECPENVPAPGASCFLEAAFWCEYGDCSSEATTVTIATCDDGSWTIYESNCNPPPPEECPAEPPQREEPCTYAGEPCGYYDCGGIPSLTAECVEGAWQISEVSCNPPEIDVDEP